MSAPNVVGLDLSIAATGCTHPDGEVETWKYAAKHGDLRLRYIADEVQALALRCPDLVVIEDLPTHAHGAGITGMVHGAARTELLRAGTPYALITPATLKKYATGKGNAGKPDMAVALYKRARIELADDNQVDAWWLRAAGLQHLGYPIVDVPGPNRDALDKVSWPPAAPLDGAR